MVLELRLALLVADGVEQGWLQEASQQLLGVVVDNDSILEPRFLDLGIDLIANRQWFRRINERSYCSFSHKWDHICSDFSALNNAGIIRLQLRL